MAGDGLGGERSLVLLLLLRLGRSGLGGVSWASRGGKRLLLGQGG